MSYFPTMPRGPYDVPEDTPHLVGGLLGGLELAAFQRPSGKWAWSARADGEVWWSGAHVAYGVGQFPTEDAALDAAKAWAGRWIERYYDGDR